MTRVVPAEKVQGVRVASKGYRRMSATIRETRKRYEREKAGFHVTMVLPHYCQFGVGNRLESDLIE